MNTELIISSLQNAKVKNLVALQQKSSERRKQGLFVVEGVRELIHCAHAGYEIENLFCCREIFDKNPEARKLDSLIGQTTIYEVTQAVYEKMAYRGSTEGMMAEVKVKNRTLADLDLPESPLIVVLESVEKPGNLGAVLRSADASKTDAVIVCNPLTDLFNPNLIRSSIGAIFTVPTVACSSQACMNFLKERNIKILTAQLQDSAPYYDSDMRGGTAIVMGTESTGLTDTWRRAADAHIRIPMLGQLDSLNVSVSAAILMFEAVRQRSFK
ncbi:RNA methyltransferase [Hallella bergensis]|uniref:TrmH family RNA methyltransferase n=1 Tax=Hallella bergensis TaxID=242750 RepID=UPI0023F0A0DC|nr:RNA methyltransferase [Hallella bergensis]